MCSECSMSCLPLGQRGPEAIGAPSMVTFCRVSELPWNRSRQSGNKPQWTASQAPPELSATLGDRPTTFNRANGLPGLGAPSDDAQEAINHLEQPLTAPADRARTCNAARATAARASAANARVRMAVSTLSETRRNCWAAEASSRHQERLPDRLAASGCPYMQQSRDERQTQSRRGLRRRVRTSRSRSEAIEPTLAHGGRQQRSPERQRQRHERAEQRPVQVSVWRVKDSERIRQLAPVHCLGLVAART